jgi:hypothetical protein
MFKLLKTKEQCKEELTAVEDWLKKVMKVQNNAPACARIAERLIADKIDAYIFERWRDWPVPDLLTLIETMNEKPTIIDPVKKRGRPPKVVEE